MKLMKDTLTDPASSMDRENAPLLFCVIAFSASCSLSGHSFPKPFAAWQQITPFKCSQSSYILQILQTVNVLFILH